MPIEILPPVVPLPEAFNIPYPELAPPVFEIPKWEPIPIKPEDIPALQPEPTEEPKNQDEEEDTDKLSAESLQEIQQLMVPAPVIDFPSFDYDYEQDLNNLSEEGKATNTVEILGNDIPVPPQEIVVTAVTTAGAAAVASVGATMVAGRAFSEIVRIAKPVIKIVLNKIAKLRGKPPALTWSRQRLESRQRKVGRTYSKGGS